MKPIHSNFLFRYFLPALFLSAAVSCKKAELRNASESSNLTSTPAQFKSLNAPQQFSWKNTQVVTLRIMPLRSGIQLQRTLKLFDASGTHQIYAGSMQLGTSFRETISLPASVSEVQLEIGTIRQLVPVSNQEIQFDLRSIRN